MEGEIGGGSMERVSGGEEGRQEGRGRGQGEGRGAGRVDVLSHEVATYFRKSLHNYSPTPPPRCALH